jgi:hypothetical protein
MSRKVAFLVSGKLNRCSRDEVYRFVQNILIPNNGDVFVLSHGSFDQSVFTNLCGDRLKMCEQMDEKQLTEMCTQIHDVWNEKMSQYSYQYGKALYVDANSKKIEERLVYQYVLLWLLTEKYRTWEKNTSNSYPRIVRSRIDHVTYANKYVFRFPEDINQEFLTGFWLHRPYASPLGRYWGIDFFFGGSRDIMFKLITFLRDKWGSLSLPLKICQHMQQLGYEDQSFAPEFQVGLALSVFISDTHCMFIPLPPLYAKVDDGGVPATMTFYTYPPHDSSNLSKKRIHAIGGNVTCYDKISWIKTYPSESLSLEDFQEIKGGDVVIYSYCGNSECEMLSLIGKIKSDKTKFGIIPVVQSFPPPPKTMSDNDLPAYEKSILSLNYLLENACNDNEILFLNLYSIMADSDGRISLEDRTKLIKDSLSYGLSI